MQKKVWKSSFAEATEDKKVGEAVFVVLAARYSCELQRSRRFGLSLKGLFPLPDSFSLETQRCQPHGAQGGCEFGQDQGKEQFGGGFLRCMGIPLCRYRIRHRMELARELLQNSLFTIDEMARQTGFADCCQFSKAHKHFFQTSLAAARKKMHLCK